MNKKIDESVFKELMHILDKSNLDINLLVADLH